MKLLTPYRHMEHAAVSFRRSKLGPRGAGSSGSFKKPCESSRSFRRPSAAGWSDGTNSFREPSNAGPEGSFRRPPPSIAGPEDSFRRPSSFTERPEGSFRRGSSVKDHDGSFRRRASSGSSSFRRCAARQAAPPTEKAPTTAQASGGTGLSASSGYEEGVRVLFIGNALTYWNGGLDRYLGELGGFAAQRVVQASASLSDLWRAGVASRAIARGGWDVIVLQEDLPHTSVEHFRQAAASFVGAARAVRAAPVLLMTWSYERVPKVTQEQISDAHAQLGRRLDVGVAPVGLAFARAADEASEIPESSTTLHESDGHPSVAGSYLAALVVWATLTGGDPRTLDSWPAGIERDEAEFLQGVAWAEGQDAMVGWISPPPRRAAPEEPLAPLAPIFLPSAEPRVIAAHVARALAQENDWRSTDPAHISVERCGDDSVGAWRRSFKVTRRDGEADLADASAEGGLDGLAVVALHSLPVGGCAEATGARGASRDAFVGSSPAADDFYMRRMHAAAQALSERALAPRRLAEGGNWFIDEWAGHDMLEAALAAINKAVSASPAAATAAAALVSLDTIECRNVGRLLGRLHVSVPTGWYDAFRAEQSAAFPMAESAAATSAVWLYLSRAPPGSSLELARVAWDWCCDQDLFDELANGGPLAPTHPVAKRLVTVHGDIGPRSIVSTGGRSHRRSECDALASMRLLGLQGACTSAAIYDLAAGLVMCDGNIVKERAFLTGYLQTIGEEVAAGYDLDPLLIDCRLALLLLWLPGGQLAPWLIGASCTDADAARRLIRRCKEFAREVRSTDQLQEEIVAHGLQRTVERRAADFAAALSQ